MGEEKAYETFCKLRWSETDGEPFCPRCGCVDVWEIKTRRKFDCKGRAGPGNLHRTISGVSV